MEVRAVGKYLRVPPRKARLIVDQVRGLPAVAALNHLKFMPQDAARYVGKVLASAIANAKENLNMSEDTLKISKVYVDEGPRIKRIQPRAMGRAFHILKRMSHITVVVEDSIVPLTPKRRRTATAETQPKPVVKATTRSKKTKEDAAVETVAPVVTGQTPVVIDETPVKKTRKTTKLKAAESQEK